MLENTEWAIKNGQSREICNIGHARRRKTKQNHNTICVNNVNLIELRLRLYF
jgi:hypothetical protein